MTGNRVRAARRRGLSLLGAAVAQLSVYVGLVWFGIFGHDGGAPACYGPHRDVFFPPATVCTPDGRAAYRATSWLASAAGSVLFLLGVCLLVAGLLALLRARPRAAVHPHVLAVDEATS